MEIVRIALQETKLINNENKHWVTVYYVNGKFEDIIVNDVQLAELKNDS